MSPVVVLLAAVAVWLVALRIDRARISSRGYPEFWWSMTVFGAGGIGTLANFELVQLTADDVSLARTLPMILTGAVMVVGALHTRAGVVPAGIWLSLLFGILLAHAFGGGSLLMTLLSISVFLPAFIAPRAGWSFTAIKSGASTGVVISLVTVSVLTILLPERMIGACRTDKCSLWGESLGAVATGNALGMFIAAACSVSLLASARVITFAAITAAGFILVDLSTSRSGLYSLMVGIGMAVAYKISVRFGRPLLVRVAAVGVGVVVAAIPYLGWTGFDLTGRALLWEHASSLFGAQPFFGYGSSYWVTAVSVPFILSNYSTHSLVPELLVSAGIVGAIAFGLALLAALMKNDDVVSACYAAAVMGIVLSLSMSEVVSAPGRTYLIPGLVVFVFVASQATQRSSPPRDVAPLQNAFELQSSIR
ncbi:O-antigen ligase family protein [Microbacterium sp. NPDC056736]|uniref:O-antigen ligase family protein n=1 Tax=Microbacterium sp. NPDC056736 TaxID=3345932 RepID=UPI00367238F7